MTQEATAMTQQQIDQIKMSLINSVQKVYTGFLEQINTIPCSLDVKKIALKEFDTGYLWLKEGIISFDFSQVQMVVPDPTQSIPTTEPETQTLEPSPFISGEDSKAVA